MHVTIKGVIPSSYDRLTKDLAPKHWCSSASTDPEGFWDIVLEEWVILKVNSNKLWLDCGRALTDLEAGEFVEVQII